MTIFCPAYGGLLPEYRIKMQLFNGAGVKIFGEPGTLYQIGNRPLRAIETLPGYTNEHQWFPLHVRFQFGNFPSANIPDTFADGEFITIYYPEGTETVGLRANGAGLSGKLPPSAKKVFLLLRNDVAGGPFAARTSFAQRNVSLANFSNWQVIRNQVEHLMLANYTYNAAGTISPEAFALPQEPHHLKTVHTVGMQDDAYELPWYYSHRFPNLEYITEEYGFKSAYSATVAGGRDADTVRFYRLPPVKYGVRLPGFNVAGADISHANRWILETFDGSDSFGWNLPPAAPGGTFRLGPYTPNTDGSDYLLGLGYTVPNENA